MMKPDQLCLLAIYSRDLAALALARAANSMIGKKLQSLPNNEGRAGLQDIVFPQPL
jgi:hypothetical protein